MRDGQGDLGQYSHGGDEDGKMSYQTIYKSSYARVRFVVYNIKEVLLCTPTQSF
jgi:hypothetical protein